MNYFYIYVDASCISKISSPEEENGEKEESMEDRAELWVPPKDSESESEEAADLDAEFKECEKNNGDNYNFDILKNGEMMTGVNSF